MDFSNTTHDMRRLEVKRERFKVALMPNGFAWAPRNQNKDNKSIFVFCFPWMKVERLEKWKWILTDFSSKFERTFVFEGRLTGMSLLYLKSCLSKSQEIKEWLCNIKMHSFPFEIQFFFTQFTHVDQHVDLVFNVLRDSSTNPCQKQKNIQRQEANTQINSFS